MFGAFFMMMVFKGVLVSMAGPAPNYDMQRILAAKSPKEAAMMSGLVTVVLFAPRYFMIAGITVLALGAARRAARRRWNVSDLEQVLPIVIRDFVPVGSERAADRRAVGRLHVDVFRHDQRRRGLSW